MNISVKNMNLTNDEKNITRGIATICIDDIFNIEGVTVKRSKEDNLYVQLPQRAYFDKETQEKKYKDACYPTNKEVREQITQVVLESYYERLKERENAKEEEKQKEDAQKKTKKSVKSKQKEENIEIEQEDEETI
ncbi:MAG: septation protein SpoVG family protein [Clostridia bacterium]|nr:septation protein SpoVG family protein [Clostridia bacterium]